MFSCTKCKAELPVEVLNSASGAQCPSCGVAMRTLVFPAALRRMERVQHATPLEADAEASCFYHPGNRASTVCDECGRFLCDICRVHMGERRLCPGCIAAAQALEKNTALETSRTLYDEMALGLAVYPLLMWFVTIVTAPAVLFIVIRYWNAPRGVIPRTKVRFVIAAVLALMQLAGWAVFFLAMAVKK